MLRDTKVFDEPENYPALRGSTLFEIRASTSFKNPERSAIAVDMIAVQGPYIEQGIHLSFLPVLIESDADFSTGAKAVIDDWTRVGEALRQWAKEKTLEKKTAPPLK